MPPNCRTFGYTGSSGSNLFYISYVRYGWLWVCTIFICGILAANKRFGLYQKNLGFRFVIW